MAELSYIDEPFEDEYCKEWRWSLPGSGRDPWWEIHLDETDRFGDERRPLPYILSIQGPGGVILDFGRFPAATPVQYVFDDPTRTHTWLLPTSYGSWEVSYTEGKPDGFLGLHVCHEGDYLETPASFIGIPSALVVELGACLTLPPAQWLPREGWMDSLTLYTMRASLKGLEPPI